MLEVFREHSKGWLAKLILAVIIIPFALFGIDSYLTQSGSDIPVATVNGNDVSMQQYSKAVQDARDAIQANSGGKVDPAMLESAKFKQSVLDRLISDRLLSEEIKQKKFLVTDEQLSNYIFEMPEFQKDGKFSQEVYDQILKRNRLSPSEFEVRMRGSLEVQQAYDSLPKLAYQPRFTSEQALRLALQERTISVAEIKAADYLNEVKIDPAQVQTYYQQNKDKFKAPQQVKLEFVLLAVNALIPAMQVAEDEVKKFYLENAAKYQGSEQRRASHILIGFGVGATPAIKQAARKKAEEVLALVKNGPDKFEALAKQYSQDTGSADKGGDLGVIARGVMVKPFEDAVFAMKPGAMSDLVESEFGYHIIKLTEVQGQGQDFNTVKSQIKGDLMYQKALGKFSEQAEAFSNMVYEQSASLQPAAKAFGLQVQSSGWLTQAEAIKFFKNDKLGNIIFTDEVLKDKRNTEAVEVSPNTLAAARVIDFKPAAIRSFDEVKAGIEDYLKLEKAAKLAVQKGEAVIANLHQGKEVANLNWIPPVVVSRKNVQGLTELVIANAFKADSTKLPSYVGVADHNKGYLLIKVSQVDFTADKAANGLKVEQDDLRKALSAEYMSSYIKSLKVEGKIVMHSERIQSEIKE
jgi:peptidyl-prolyl cis-trans isomerase D